MYEWQVYNIFQCTMNLCHCLDSVITCLQENNFTIPTLIQSILTSSSDSHCACRESLLFGATDVCSDLSRMQSDIVFSWAFETTKKRLHAEVVALTQTNNGLHFNASNTTAEHLEGSFMANAAQKMKEIAPYLWDLVYALLDANPLHQHVMAESKTDAEVMEGLAADGEGDLGKIGGDSDMNMEEDHGDPGNEAVDE